MSMIIDRAEVIVTSPDRNFVTLRLTTDDGLVGLGDATLNGRELAVVSLPRRSRRAAAHRPRRAPHRGHLAVPLPLRLLAARAGDHGRDRRGRHRALGHQGARPPGCRCTSCSAARAGAACWPTGTRRARTCRSSSTRSARIWQQGYRAIRIQTGVPGLKAIYGIASQRDLRGERRGALRPRARAARRASPPRRTGTPARTCGTSRPCSRRCATSSVPSCRCCTTATTA